MSSQPFKIGDIVTFVEDPASTFERVVNITWIDVAPIPHWQVETAWQFPGEGEHRRIADAAELRHHAAVSAAEAGRFAIASFGADDLNEPPSDENPVELWRRYQQAFALFNALAEPGEEDEATFCAVVDEIERIATDQVPTTLDGVLLRLRLIQHSQETTMWGGFEDKLIARAIEGLGAMAASGG